MSSIPADRPTIVILPGLDGTGRLLTDFVETLERRYRVAVVTYPLNEPLTYEALLDYTKERLPAEEYIIIGESFSGPLAMRIASEDPPFLKALVLGASFARLDLPFKRAIAALAGRVPPSAVPFAFFNALLMNGHATADQRNLLKRVLCDVSPEVLAIRAREALLVDLVGTHVSVGQPLLYLRASADRLIPAGAADVVASVAENTTIRNIPAPHFLFQAEPKRCADAIDDFCDSFSREPHRFE